MTYEQYEFMSAILLPILVVALLLLIRAYSLLLHEKHVLEFKVVDAHAKLLCRELETHEARRALERVQTLVETYERGPAPAGPGSVSRFAREIDPGGSGS